MGVFSSKGHNPEHLRHRIKRFIHMPAHAHTHGDRERGRICANASVICSSSILYIAISLNSHFEKKKSSATMTKVFQLHKRYALI